jgi:hypothetical protein
MEPIASNMNQSTSMTQEIPNLKDTRIYVETPCGEKTSGGDDQAIHYQKMKNIRGQSQQGWGDSKSPLISLF